MELLVGPRYFLWLCGTVNLLQGAGYFLFSGVAGIGDWAVFVEGLGPRLPWRIFMTLVGAVSYYLAVRYAVAEMGPFIGGQPDLRRRRASTLMLIPFVVGAALYVGAGWLHPDGSTLLLVSAAASSLGGTSGFAWGPQLLRGDDIPGFGGEIVPIERSWAWVATGGVVTASFVLLLGPGLRFS